MEWVYSTEESMGTFQDGLKCQKHRNLQSSVSAHWHRLVFCRWSGFFGAIESAQVAFEAVSVSAGGGGG